MLNKMIKVYYDMQYNNYFIIDTKTLFSAIYYSYAESVTYSYCDKTEKVLENFSEISTQ